jgi:hypothetical protein
MDRWLAGILVAFAIVVGINGVFLVLAMENFPTLETSYLEGER